MISRVEAKNFFSWESLDFEVKKGVTLIDGDNLDTGCSEAAGKTAVLNAISWGLYGKIPKELNTDDVIRYGQKKCVVKITFEGGMIVTRSRKPNDLYYGLEGVKLRGKDARETQKNINDMLGMSYEAFLQTTYHSQNSQYNFLQANSEDKSRIMSEMIDLDVYDLARKRAHEKLKIAEGDIVESKHDLEISQSSFNLIVTKIEAEEKVIERKKENHLQKITSSEAKIKSLRSRIEDQTFLFEKLRTTHDSDISDMDVNIKSLKDISGGEAITIKDLSSKLLYQEQGKAKDSEVDESRTKLAALRAEVQQRDQLVKLRAEKKSHAQDLAKTYQTKKKELEDVCRFIKNPSKDCPTCGTTLKNCSTHEAETTVSNLEIQLDRMRVKVTQITKDLKEPLPNVEDYPPRIAREVAFLATHAEVLLVIRKLELDLQSIRSCNVGTLERLNRSVVQIKHSLLNPPEIDPKFITDLEESIDKEKLILADLKKINLPDSTVRMVGLEGERFALEVKISAHGERHLGLERKAVIFSELKRSFREIKSYISEGVLVELNQNVNGHLEELFEVGCNISFTNDSGKLACNAVLDGEVVRLGNFSGGQFRRASLAVDLALHEVSETRSSSKIGVLILDEYFKDLSEESMEKCLTLLSRLNMPVLMVEHNTLFKSLIDHTFKVVKEEGVSRHG